MSPLDALWHLLNFLAPAWAVAVLVAHARREAGTKTVG